MNRIVVGLFVLAAALPAQASFHLMLISEVYGGSVENPDSQYVELVMYSSGQNFVGGHEVQVFGADGTLLDEETFADQVPNGAVQSRILIATPEAQAEFDLAADLL